MAAIIKFNQVGLPAGTDNRARTDIVAGTLVTITDVSPGSIDTLELLWKPPEDDTAVLVGSGPTWTIVPKAGTSGIYRCKLTVDGVSVIRIFGTRTPKRGLLKLGANEIADPTASLVKNTATEIERSENNEAFPPFTSGSAWGWLPGYNELVDEVDDISAGSSDKTSKQNKNMAALATAGDGDQACAVAIQVTPNNDGYVRVHVNGVAVVLGDGAKTESCYFSDDAGATAKAIADIALGDVLFWNGSVAGYQLATTDRLAFDYSETV